MLFIGCAIWGGILVGDDDPKNEPAKDMQNNRADSPVLTSYEKGLNAFFNDDYREATKQLRKISSCDTCFYNPRALLSIIEWRTANDKEKYISKRISKKWYALLSLSDDVEPSMSIQRYQTDYTNKGDKVYSEEYFTDGRLIDFSCDDRNTIGSSNNYRYVVDGSVIKVILPYATEKYTVEHISDNIMITKPDMMNIRSYFINSNSRGMAEQELLTLSRLATADIESRVDYISSLITEHRYIDAYSNILTCRSRIAFRSAIDTTFVTQEVNNLFVEMQAAIMPKVEAEYIDRYNLRSKSLFTKLEESSYHKESLLDSLSLLVRECDYVVHTFNTMGYNVPKLTQFSKSLNSSFSKERKNYELYGNGDRDNIMMWAETEAKVILKEFARDPRSVKIEKVVCDGRTKDGWKCRVQYRAKNGFGGYDSDVLTVIMAYDAYESVYKCKYYSF